MERSVLLFAFVVNLFNCLAGQNWTFPQGKIKFVFECERNEKKVELLRLYTSGEYEQIEYLFQKNKPEIVHRNLGTYEIKKSKLVVNKPTCKEFGPKFSTGEYFFRQNLYKSAVDAFLHKKEFLCLKTTKKENKKPFFIGINSDEIVSNNAIEKAFTLSTLVEYVTKDATDDKAKVIAISKFICRSIEYDHEGLAKDNYAHRQDDIYGILSSKNRVAVCAGYAYVFDSLARIAKVQTREVSGYTKQGYGNYNKLGGLHAWNIVALEGKEYYIDVTWSDDKKDIDMAWMFVDPEMILGSHFPLEAKDILYKNTFTSDDFRQREVVMPRKEFALIKHYSTTSWVRITGDYFTLKFKSKVDVKVNWLDAGITEFKYSNEKSSGAKSYRYNEIENIRTYFLKDTFYVEIPIPKQEVALNINVSDEYDIQTHIFKGNENEYCKQLMAKWNKEHVIAFTEGILAAIKIGDTQFLKEKLGDKYFALYNKKNQWKLSKDLLANIKKWDGTAQQLDGLDEWKYVNNKYVLEEHRFIKYNTTDKVYVKFENNKYELLCIK
jgi:hypothetical protein